MLNNIATDDVKLHLFNNNATLSDNTILNNLTECSAQGYSAITLAGVSWTVQTVAGVSSATYAARTFTFNAADNAYGYYVTDNASANLLWVEDFPSVFTLPSGGGNVIINPRITLAHT